MPYSNDINKVIYLIAIAYKSGIGRFVGVKKSCSVKPVTKLQEQQ